MKKLIIITILAIATLLFGTVVKAEHGVFINKEKENPGIDFGENQLANICIASLIESGATVNIDYEIKDGCDPAGGNFKKYESLLRYAEDGTRMIFAINKITNDGGKFYTEKRPTPDPSATQNNEKIDALLRNEIAKNDNASAANNHRADAVESGKKKLKLANNITTLESVANFAVVYISKKSPEGKTTTLQQISAATGIGRALTGADYDRISANANIANMEGDCIATGGCVKTNAAGTTVASGYYGDTSYNTSVYTSCFDSCMVAYRNHASCARQCE